VRCVCVCVCVCVLFAIISMLFIPERHIIIYRCVYAHKCIIITTEPDALVFGDDDEVWL